MVSAYRAQSCCIMDFQAPAPVKQWVRIPQGLRQAKGIQRPERIGPDANCAALPPESCLPLYDRDRKAHLQSISTSAILTDALMGFPC